MNTLNFSEHERALNECWARYEALHNQTPENDLVEHARLTVAYTREVEEIHHKHPAAEEYMDDWVDEFDEPEPERHKTPRRTRFSGLGGRNTWVGQAVLFCFVAAWFVYMFLAMLGIAP